MTRKPTPSTVKPTYTPTFRTVYPKNQPKFDEWVRQYQVSMLYDRKPVYMEM